MEWEDFELVAMQVIVLDLTIVNVTADPISRFCGQ